MKKLLYIFVLVLLVLTACGSPKFDYKEEARAEWDAMTEAEQENACLGYNILGEKSAAKLAEDSKFPEAKVGALLKIFKEEC